MWCSYLIDGFYLSSHYSSTFLVYQIIIIMFHCFIFFYTILYVCTNHRFTETTTQRWPAESQSSYRTYSKCLIPTISGSFINCGSFRVTDIKPVDRTKNFVSQLSWFYCTYMDILLKAQAYLNCQSFKKGESTNSYNFLPIERAFFIAFDTSFCFRPHKPVSQSYGVTFITFIKIIK